jgi:hypothetical protein
MIQQGLAGTVGIRPTTLWLRKGRFYWVLVGAVGIEHDPQDSKSRECAALPPPSKSKC